MHFNTRTEAVAVARASNQSEKDGMTSLGGFIAQNDWRSIVCGYDRIQAAVVVKISNRQPASDNFFWPPGRNPIRAPR